VNATPAAPTPDELVKLRQDIPDFRIWREMIGDRARYIVRSMRPGISPHTLVTADLGELREVLSNASARQQAARQGELLPVALPAR